jgi:hypothetical protein
MVAQQRAELKTSALVRVWGRFSGLGSPLVYVTGFDHCPGILYSMSNLYMNDMLACWYNITHGSEVGARYCND